MSDYVVLDTDVASLSFRGRLTSPMSALLAGKLTCVTFVTVGEMTKWAELRDWGPRNRQRLELWLSGQVQLGYDLAIAQTWGRLAAAGQRRGRTTPVNDTWIAACCLAEGLPLAALNVKDYLEFSQHHGLTLIGSA
ncbi:type II toxin-antitoxin system VapC family toxin [Planosporangium sp. 12N6]|uniref:type II toxin-antitoxin system VapC family toxin n=1 Tax=Planosporangium spinosum TaxID=3402278 RepID=UPI003CF144EE